MNTKRILDMEAINKYRTPGIGPSGIGGFGNKIFSVDKIANKIYEHNLDTLEIIKTYNSPGTHPTDIGGVDGRLFSIDHFTRKIYEYNPDTMEVITIYDAPGENPSGIGGANGRLFSVCDKGYTRTIYELNIGTMNTMEVINEWDVWHDPMESIRSIGGANGRLFSIDSKRGKIYEHDLDTLKIINEWEAPGFLPYGFYGIGGTDDRLFCGNIRKEEIFEVGVKEKTPETKIGVIKTHTAPYKDPYDVDEIKKGKDMENKKLQELIDINEKGTLKVIQGEKNKLKRKVYKLTKEKEMWKERYIAGVVKKEIDKIGKAATSETKVIVDNKVSNNDWEGNYD